MRIHDISVPISVELPTYPGDCTVEYAPWTRVAHGELANVSRLTVCTHAGTHLDPPCHFLDGAQSVDQIPLSRLMGRALVVEVHDAQQIGHKELERLPVRGAERVLVKTKNSELWKKSGFQEDFAALSPDGARYLIEAGVKLVGIDYLSIEPFSGDGSVHRTLLENDVLILEGLDLSDVEPGEYELICLPLKIKGGDGAPVRAVLRRAAAAGEEPRFDPHTTKWPLA